MVTRAHHHVTSWKKRNEIKVTKLVLVYSLYMYLGWRGDASTRKTSHEPEMRISNKNLYVGRIRARSGKWFVNKLLLFYFLLQISFQEYRRKKHLQQLLLLNFLRVNYNL